MHLDCRGEVSSNRNASKDESVESGDESVEAGDESIEAGEKTQQSCYNMLLNEDDVLIVLKLRTTLLGGYLYRSKHRYFCEIFSYDIF